ncbi:MAG TPA: hypothetical protein VFQ39_10065 [Longimicrobium sp.]|nr:hypothetical protein [Longimicrobium sp.]
MATPASPFAGDWIYRSYVNTDLYPIQTNDDARTLQNFESLLFGEGQLHLETDARGYLTSSTLSFGPGYLMNVDGVADGAGTTPCQAAPATVRMKAFGVDGQQTAGWLYEYVGYLAPAWPNGVDQVDAIVGTVIRVVPHGTGKAGVVASFVAVRAAAKAGG